jgi:hypothetical protein
MAYAELANAKPKATANHLVIYFSWDEESPGDWPGLNLDGEILHLPLASAGRGAPHTTSLIAVGLCLDLG